MQKIEFQEIKFKNFRIHSEGYLQFKNNCLTAIVGKNGKGKSSYLMAIMAVLYGRTADGIELPDLVNKKVGKNLEIHLKLKIDDDQYVISRYYKHNQHMSKLIVLKNGEDFSRKNITETYNLISSLIIPREVFLTIIYFSQQVKDFFTALTDSQQKEIFSNIFQLNEYKVKYDTVFEKIKVLLDESLQIDRDKAKVQNTIEAVQTSINGLDEAYKNWQAIKNQRLQFLSFSIESNSDLLSTVKDKRSNLSYSEVEFKSLIESIGRNKSLLDGVVELLSKTENELNTKINEVTLSTTKQFDSQLSLELSKINQMINEKTTEILDNINDISKKKSELIEETNIQSNKLKDELDSKTKEFKQKLNDLNTVRSDLQEESSKINVDQQKLKDLELEFEKKKSRSMTEMTSIKNTADGVKKEIETYKLKIQEFDSNPEVCPTCGQKIVDNQHIEKEREKINKKLEYCDKQISDLRQTFSRSKEEFDKVVKQYSETIQITSFDINNRHTNNLSKLNTINGEIEIFSKKISEVEQDIDKRSRKINEEKDTKKSEFDRMMFIITDQKKQLELEKNKLIAICNQKNRQDLKNSLTEQIDKFKDSSNSSKKELCEKQKSLGEEIKNQEFTKSSLIENKEQILKYEIQITQLENEIKNLRLQEDLLIKEQYDLNELNRNKKSIIELQSQLQKISLKDQEIKRKIQILEFWKEGFSDRGIPSMLIDSWIPYLNNRVCSELDRVAPGKFIINFDTTSTNKSGDVREKFNINIMNLESGADKHSLLSGGEKRQVDVCCMRALRKLVENLYQKHFNICLLDEVLDSLDEENSSLFCRNLKFLSKDESVILVTHSITQNSECDEVIRL